MSETSPGGSLPVGDESSADDRAGPVSRMSQKRCFWTLSYVKGLFFRGLEPGKRVPKSAVLDPVLYERSFLQWAARSAPDTRFLPCRRAAHGSAREMAALWAA
jgi:hypothetical protein